MKRRLLIGLFTFGTIFGFGSGLFSMARWHHHAEHRRANFERHVADVCTDAAYRARDRGPREAPPPRADDRMRRGAYDQGYEQGYDQGYDRGYEQGYDHDYDRGRRHRGHARHGR